MISLYRADSHTLVVSDAGVCKTDELDFDQLFQSDDPQAYLEPFVAKARAGSIDVDQPWLAPIGNQEIWAAGVTYYRSRTARMEESEQSGGDRFYDMVYEAERPELFLKSTAARARGHRAPVGIRADSSWDVPEPELTLAINTSGKVFGYTIGNDMSSRSIDGENPLYLPQAKVYRASCAIGPCLVVGADAVNDETKISISIERNAEAAFSGEIEVSQIKRGFDELAEFLFRDNEFPHGSYLMTGTGIVPDSSFTLQSGDRIRISIQGIGTLENEVA